MFGRGKIYEQALALYAGTHVVERVNKMGKEALLRSVEEVELTLLMQDIKPFTTFSEGLSSGNLAELMNQYLDVMFECILEHGGVIDHFRGDAIFAYWESDANQVVAAVKKSKQIGKELSEKWKERIPQDIVPIHGIDRGVVIRGNFGSKNRLSYSIIGDVVNYTARLCAANNHYKTQSLFSGRVRKLVEKQDELEFVDSIIVKGRLNKEEIFTLEDIGH